MVDPCTIAVVAIAGSNVVMAVTINGPTIVRRTQNWYREQKYNTVNINKSENLHLFAVISKTISPYCRQQQNRSMITITYPWNSLASEEKKGEPVKETNKVLWGPVPDSEITIQVGEHKDNSLYLFAYSLDGKHISGFQIYYHSSKENVFEFFMGTVLDDLRINKADSAMLLPDRPSELEKPVLSWYVRLWRWFRGLFVKD